VLARLRQAGGTAVTAIDMGEDGIRVFLKNLQTEAHCGMHPWERHPQRPTRLIVNVELIAKLTGRAAAKGIIDYDRIRDYVRAFPQRPHTDLLETLADDLAAKCFEDPKVDACRVSIVKPDIFNEAEGAGVEVYRTRAMWAKDHGG
jgi:dihydroneopterin aldolase